MRFKVAEFVDNEQIHSWVVMIEPDPGAPWECISSEFFSEFAANKRMLLLKRINRICSGKPLLRTVLKIERV